jgi:hypothetical protein
VSRDRLLDVAAFVVLFVAGLAAGIWCVFLVPLRIGGEVEGLADVLGGLAAAGLGMLGAWGTGRVAAAAMPGLGALVAIGVSGSTGPGGDILLPGGVAHDSGVGVVAELLLLTVLLGMVAAIVVAARRNRGVSEDFTSPRPPPTTPW